MTEALRFHSWRGDCAERIKAIDIRSRSAAIELGPFKIVFVSINGTKGVIVGTSFIKKTE